MIPVEISNSCIRIIFIADASRVSQKTFVLVYFSKLSNCKKFYCISTFDASYKRIHFLFNIHHHGHNIVVNCFLFYSIYLRKSHL